MTRSFVLLSAAALLLSACQVSEKPANDAAAEANGSATADRRLGSGFGSAWATVCEQRSGLCSPGTPFLAPSRSSRS